LNERADRHFRAKVASFLTLRPDEISFAASLTGNPREFPRGAALFSQGMPLASSYVLLSGWAMRFKTLTDGRRQVLGVLLPGDLVGSEAHLLAEATATVTALTPIVVSEFRPATIVRMFEEQPRLAASLLWMNAREEAFLGERLLSVGRQSAFERVGHFFVELYHRLSLIGEAPGGEFDCPLTLEIIADAIGMSMVHASRTMQVLRKSRMLARAGRTVRILDLARLERETDFAGLYLGRRLGDGELFLQPKIDGA
jgi:CRP-like cAMP-binding protein